MCRFYTIIHEEPDGGYSAEVPALPGCYTDGDTLDEVKAKLNAGELHVFDTSTFTVTVVTEGENKKNVNAVVDENGRLTSYKADVDTDAAYTADTEVVSDGYCHECEYRSAPYFDIQSDGITLLNAKF